MTTNYIDCLIDPKSIKIRLLEERDLPALEWGGEYLHFRRLYREIYKNTVIGKSLMWGVELLQGELIGQVFVQLSSSRLELANGTNRAYIYSFRIKPPFRNHGIGSRLLSTVECDLVERKFVWATLNVAKDNPMAFRFYERSGYQKVAAEAGYWTYQDHLGETREVHEPAWRMEKRLLPQKPC